MGARDDPVAQVANHLVHAGFRHVCVLKGGIDALKTKARTRLQSSAGGGGGGGSGSGGSGSGGAMPDRSTP